MCHKIGNRNFLSLGGLKWGQGGDVGCHVISVDYQQKAESALKVLSVTETVTSSF